MNILLDSLYKSYRKNNKSIIKKINGGGGSVINYNANLSVNFEDIKKTDTLPYTNKYQLTGFDRLNEYPRSNFAF